MKLHVFFITTLIIVGLWGKPFHKIIQFQNSNQDYSYPYSTWTQKAVRIETK